MLYQTLGATRFRKEEADLILALEPAKASVISLGGGAVLDPAVRKKVKELGSVIHLWVEKKVVLENRDRFLSGAFFQGKDLDAYYEERMSIYREIADYEIEVMCDR